MTMDNSQKMILEEVENELNNVLFEMLNTKEITDSTADQLKDVYKKLNTIELDDLEEADKKEIEDKLNLIELTLEKYQEQHDTTTLVKMTVYLTPSQIHYLDKVAEEQGLSKGNKRAGSRSAALRFILDQVKK